FAVLFLQPARMGLTPFVVIVATVVSAGASFFFSLAETSLFSLGTWQARQLAERKPGAGGTVVWLLGRPQDLLASIALGNTFANAAIMGVALSLAVNGRWPLALAAAAAMALILIGCEVLPKTMAVRRPEQWALRIARPMRLILTLTQPLCRVAQGINSAL